MEWTEMPLEIQVHYAEMKGKIPPDVIMAFEQELDEETASYVRDVVDELRASPPYDHEGPIIQ